MAATSISTKTATRPRFRAVIGIPLSWSAKRSEWYRLRDYESVQIVPSARTSPVGIRQDIHKRAKERREKPFTRFTRSFTPAEKAPTRSLINMGKDRRLLMR